MNLQQLIQQYLAYRRSLGWRPRSHGDSLGTFGRFIGKDVDIADVRVEQVNAFLTGRGPVTTSWHIKYGILRSFYRYATSRGYVVVAPLPAIPAKRPPAFVPYIFSHDELRRVLKAFDSVCDRKSSMEAATMRTFILLLYGAGLRRQEAINLDWPDVDWEHSVLTIRNTKFLKTRLVPIGPQLKQRLLVYAESRTQRSEGPFFIRRTGVRINCLMLQRYFRLACERAGVRRTDNLRFQPRLHDLRHTFAVHRMTSWYQQGADVQRLLPQLSTYLGHVCIRHTQVYLTMTPSLLQEACDRFAQYARGGTP